MVRPVLRVREHQRGRRGPRLGGDESLLRYLPGGPIERLTEAVAVAGLQAAASNRPRGVLLVSGTRFAEEAEDGLDPLAIREYLATLHVPFFYWRIDEGGDATPDGWVSLGSSAIAKTSTVRRRRSLPRCGLNSWSGSTVSTCPAT